MASIKGKLPRFAPAKGKLFSRMHFLDGTLITAIGPGQNPDPSQPYSPPTDWPVKGSLLALPQMVWLSFSGGAFPSDGGVGPTLDYFSLSQAVQAAFVAVQTKLQSIRPNRTYVNMASSGGSGFLPMFPLPPATPPFLPLPFLHVWVGDLFLESSVGDVGTGTQWAKDYAITSTGTSTGNLFVGTPFTGTQHVTYNVPPSHYNQVYAGGSVDYGAISAAAAAYTALPGYATSLDNMTAVAPLFDQYAVRLYPSDLPVDPGSPMYTVIPGKKNNGGFRDTFTVTLVGDPQFTAACSLLGPLQCSVDVLNQVLTDFAAYDVKLSGVASEVTVDTLMNQIAAFFHFDPSTGADLPQTS